MGGWAAGGLPPAMSSLFTSVGRTYAGGRGLGAIIPRGRSTREPAAEYACGSPPAAQPPRRRSACSKTPFPKRAMRAGVGGLARATSVLPRSLGARAKRLIRSPAGVGATSEPMARKPEAPEFAQAPEWIEGAQRAEGERRALSAQGLPQSRRAGLGSRACDPQARPSMWGPAPKLAAARAARRSRA